MPFSHLGLSPKVLAAVEAAGYTEPTPIQEQAIPHVLEHKDVLGIAQTGTGKTASFTLPMLTLLEGGRARARMPRTLILEPTRELAAQVEEEFGRYGSHHKLSMALLIGGLSFGDQDMKLTRGVDVLIATPGRLLDHFERGRLLLSGIEILVIDEADRMLDMGFIPDIERICKLIPPSRQTLFFSATMPPEIQKLVSQFLRDPVRVEVSKPASVVGTVTQKLVATGAEPHEKRETLRDLIRSEKDFKNAIVFSNRKRDVGILHRSLQRHGFNAAALHGDLDQRARMAALDSFRTGKAALLIASDVAARGLDIPAVSHVFNFDVPIHAEDYVHRIGRTGRAGLLGTAVTLVAPGDQRYVAAIEALTGQTLEWEGAPLSADAAPPRRGRGGDERRGRGAGRSHGERRDHRPPRSGDRAPPRREEVAEAAPPPPPRNADRPREPRAPRRDEEARRRPLREAGERPTVGLGDHVPQFLLRPVRAASHGQAGRED
jgi:superfamily II DNA/RNA helicase